VTAGNGADGARPVGRTARFSLTRRRRGDSNAPDSDVPIIETRDVTKHFSAGRDSVGRTRPTLKAVDGVSLTIQRGETLALVGETGSGKTTFGRLLLGLYRPTSGDILYRGQSILDPKSPTARTVRRQVQGVFQDPYSSLNPTMTIGQSLTEVLKVHDVVPRSERADQVAELLSTVGSGSGSGSPARSPCSPRS
jgi:ABC-type glutathione transport system ATPase component